ncbi:hypothetical protein D1007_49236 [Hordeum vulgare]|nr:hypothetical protein D1007_49236 [Hordeum vulgare]
MSLMVRWEWLRRTGEERPWQGLKLIVDDDAREIFDSLVSISVGDGKKILFWQDRSINGKTVAEIAPSIVCVIPTRTKNSRTVHEALGERRWLYDIRDGLTFTMQLHLYMLQQAISFVERDEGRPDAFTWPGDASGSYTTTLTYKRLCTGQTYFQAALIWKCWAHLKCKIFIWLVVQYQAWTSDRRARHGLQDHQSVWYACHQQEDNVDHILVQCPFAREVWNLIRANFRMNLVNSSQQASMVQWWNLARNTFRKRPRRGFDSLFIVTALSLWK